mmetsp:Transcript_7058/g.25965  ORF Transcript_7058/g.25965 Transcript_7058/m.25965 type:complete len:203 (-) Transcript_7058:269-877(-)
MDGQDGFQRPRDEALRRAAAGEERGSDGGAVDGGRRRFKEREYKVTRRNKRRREIPKIDHRTRSLPSLSSVGHFFSSTIASASTGIPNGNPAHPTALLELFPAGPNTSMNKLARPFTTAGCFVYSEVQLTNPFTLTTLAMTSRLPNCCRIVASIVSPTTRAASTASSSVKSSEPHLPTTRLPSAFRGTWPLTYARSPTRTTG